MYKNLNDLNETNLNMNYNNVGSLTDISSQLNTPILFTKNDVQFQAQTGKKKLIINNRIIKNCVVRCPNGQIWTGLDYKIHQKTNQNDCDKTIFYLTYAQLQDGNYFIYPGNSNRGVQLYNADSLNGINILDIHGSNYAVKRLVAGNGISLRTNNKQILVSLGQGTFNKELKNLKDNQIIDVYNGDVQFFYTNEDCQIKDLIDTSFYFSSSSTSSDSSFSSQSSASSDDFNCLCVVVYIYKPYQTLIKYKDNIVLNKYDIGWFSLGIKKMFGFLFISQATRIITDYNVL